VDGEPTERRRVAGDHLLQVMSGVLDRGLGAPTWLGPGMFGFGATASALIQFSCFALLWAVTEGIGMAMRVRPEPQLISLIGWGGCYAAAATFLCMVATEAVFDTVKRDILPYASPEYCTSVAADLERHFPRALLTWVPVAIAAASAICAYLAIERDLCGTGHTCRRVVSLRAPEFWFWAITFFYYFLCAGRVVIAGRFYLSFARCLEQESGAFYVLGASETPLIKGLARMSGHLLGFWAMIFLCVLSSMLLAALPLGAFGFKGSSWLLFTLVPITGFFSLGFGSLVYLVSEAQIRTVLKRYTSLHAAALQREVNALFEPGTRQTKAAGEALKRTAELHDRILAGGAYGSRLRAVLSVALPLLLPIVSIIQTAVGWLSH
jgi:hypothetical protein